METLEYTNFSIINSEAPSDLWVPVTDKLEKHISIQRLHHFRDSGRDNFSRILWIMNGVDSVTINDVKFKPFPYLIVFILPGINLKLETSGQTEGWILRLSQSYLNMLRHENFPILNANLFSHQDEVPKLVLSPKIGRRIHSLVGMIDELAGSEIPMKENGIKALLKAILVYCHSKCNLNLNENGSRKEVNLVSQFKLLVTNNYSRYHLVSDYANMMNITPKYLNYVVKRIMGIRAKQVIQEQLIIHARYDLKFSNLSIKEIAFMLGFADPYHFSSFFKDLVGSSPSQYRDK